MKRKGLDGRVVGWDTARRGRLQGGFHWRLIAELCGTRRGTGAGLARKFGPNLPHRAQGLKMHRGSGGRDLRLVVGDPPIDICWALVRLPRKASSRPVRLPGVALRIRRKGRSKKRKELALVARTRTKLVVARNVGTTGVRVVDSERLGTMHEPVLPTQRVAFADGEICCFASPRHTCHCAVGASRQSRRL